MQPTASRWLAELEATLGEPLFVRRVDGTRLTAFGERVVLPARRMAEAAAEVERTVEGADRAPRGTVRITAPPGLAAQVLVPFAATLRARLPEIELEVISTVRYVDLVRREAALALRIPSAERSEAPRDLHITSQIQLACARASLAVPRIAAVAELLAADLAPVRTRRPVRGTYDGRR